MNRHTTVRGPSGLYRECCGTRFPYDVNQCPNCEQLVPEARF
ncbi:hypothetical protein [Haloprofundus salilacus]|nr:hypothetical protein [Haloprofundus salilacus]